MRYVIYGVDAVSQTVCAPLTLDATSEEEARGRAVARGMAVRAVIADQEAERPSELVASSGPAAQAQAAGDSDEARSLRRGLAMVLLPVALAFFLLIALVRTVMQAANWTVVWGLGALLGGGLAGLLGWMSRGAVPAQNAWPIGLALGVTILSGVHGARVGWRWWWAKRTLSPLAQALGAAPEEAADDERTGWRVRVLLVQCLAGAVLGTLGAFVGWATEWGVLTVAGCAFGGALGLGAEGAILGIVLARGRPIAPPGAVAGPSFESLAWLLGRSGIAPRAARYAVVGYAIDRAAPGAVGGTLVGILTVLLARFAVGH